MPVTYQYLTAEQQRTTAEQLAFQYEHSHFMASLELEADPDNVELQAKVANLEALIVVAKLRVNDSGGQLPAPEVPVPVIGDVNAPEVP